MSRRKPPSAGIGREKGNPNRVTRDARAVLAAFVENNVDKAQSLFDRVAVKNPAKALELFAKLSEFVVPKLARTEVIANNKPFQELPNFGINFPRGGPGQPLAMSDVEAAQIYQRVIDDPRPFDPQPDSPAIESMEPVNALQWERLGSE